MAIAVDNVTTIVEQDTLKSWFRLIFLFTIGVIGTVGMWSVVVVLPALETEFNIDRGNASLLYADYNGWFWFRQFFDWKNHR